MARRITIVPYDPSWRQQYAAAAERLRQVLGPELRAVHHIGSTAVSGLVAKPTIDVLLEVHSLAGLDAKDEAMRAAGYEPRGVHGLAGRRTYVRGTGDAPREHVSAWEAGHRRIADYLAFRDYLRARPEARLAYGRLKLALAAEHNDEPAAYTAGKDAFIGQVLALAEALADCRGGCGGQAQLGILRLPDWVPEVADPSVPYRTPEAMMDLAVRLSRENVLRGTGGPFGAVVFECETGRLVAAGVNLVTTERVSWAHAEMVALALAQETLGVYDLSARGALACALVSSAEPCAMCLGAVPWSGVRELYCGARDADVRAIGFDEGHKPADWVAALEARGISVQRDLLRDEAVSALRAYAERGGAIYNSGQEDG